MVTQVYMVCYILFQFPLWSKLQAALKVPKEYQEGLNQ